MRWDADRGSVEMMPTIQAAPFEASHRDVRRATREIVRPAPFVFGLALLVGVALAPRARAQAIRGRVYDLATGAGVAGAEVALWRGQVPEVTVRADSTGQFLVLAKDTGTFQLLSRRVGYFGGGMNRLRLMTRDTFELVIRLERIVQMLDALKTEAKQTGIDFTNGFEERRKKGIGPFIGPAEIEKKGFQRAPELVAGTPGLLVVVDASLRPGLQISRIQSARATGLDVCEPALFVDGFQVDPESLYRDYSSTSIEAIEVYQASQVPARFSTGRSLCGVVLFWTRGHAGKDR